MHDRHYHKGDFVFATCPNYKPWPAYITKIQNEDVFHVKFFNHKSTAYIKKYDLIDFNEITVRRFRKMYKNTLDVQELKILKGIQIAKNAYQRKKKDIQRETSQKQKLQQKKGQLYLDKYKSSRQKSQSLEIKQQRQTQIDKDKNNQHRLIRQIPIFLQTKEILQKIKIKYKHKQQISQFQTQMSIRQKHEFSSGEKQKQIKNNFSDTALKRIQNKQIITQNIGKIILNSLTTQDSKFQIKQQRKVIKNMKKQEKYFNQEIKQKKKGDDQLSIQNNQQLLESPETGPRMYIYSQNLKYINFRYNYDDCSLDCSLDQKDYKQGSQLALLKGVLMKKVLLENKPTSFVCDLLRNYLQILQKHLQSKSCNSESQCLLSMKQRQILIAIFQCNHISLECLVSQKVLKPMINFILTFEKARGKKKRFFRIEYIIIRSRLNINSHLFQHNYQDYSLFGEEEGENEDYLLIFQKYDSRTVK